MPGSMGQIIRNKTETKGRGDCKMSDALKTSFENRYKVRHAHRRARRRTCGHPCFVDACACACVCACAFVYGHRVQTCAFEDQYPGRHRACVRVARMRVRRAYGRVHARAWGCPLAVAMPCCAAVLWHVLQKSGLCCETFVSSQDALFLWP